jgi:hypothetical protein
MAKIKGYFFSPRPQKHAVRTNGRGEKKKLREEIHTQLQGK